MGAIKLYAHNAPQKIMDLLEMPYTPPSKEDLDLTRREYQQIFANQGRSAALSDKEVLELYNVNWVKALLERLKRNPQRAI